ncbi:glucose/sorbosone family PQQ-dependent dehydrogenase [Bauldia sp.]|uniref:glucose/sorbosone family PQQ-dependent dehydrogenase n=1 Tax=Bauldia sp. TaxID=2575872 RepID=UPI003BAA2251
MQRTIIVAFAILGAHAPTLAQNAPDSVVTGTVPFEMRVVATGLESPWEVTWGPDGHLWVTERTAGRIVRVDPADGEVTKAIEIDEASAPGGQDGLLGLALHPELLQGTGNDYVYTSYTYPDPARGPDETVPDEANPYRYLYMKIVRLMFDPDTGTLGEPVEIIAGLPASNDHNSGRLKIGPDGKLYMAIGDGGKNQLGNWCLPIESQRLPTAAEIDAGDYIAYQGKSLRMNLDGSIPADNPDIDGVRSHVYTYGHRNMQGLAFAPDGMLYGSEHGPKSDDEVNVLDPGENYGWPHISGFRDDMAYQYARWADATTPCEDLRFSDIDIEPSVPVTDENAWPGEAEDPLATLFTVPSDWSFTDPACDGIHFICWPTVAPSSIHVYQSGGGGVPGWSPSLLVPTLKHGSLYRIPLTNDGHTQSGPIERYFQSENRFRDIAIAPDHRTIFVATDSGGIAQALDGGVAFEMENPGAILAFTYTGDSDPEPAGGGDRTDLIIDDGADVRRAAIEGGVFTEAQAERGRRAYAAHCITCHGPTLAGTPYGTPLAGDYFAKHWAGRSIAALYDHSHDTMPPSRPADLTDQAYVDIVAYVLLTNGRAAGSVELLADAAHLNSATIGD